MVIIYCLSFFILRFLITSFASFGYYILSVLLYITASDYIFRIFWLLYIVCPLYYGFWLHLSHLLVIIYCLSFKLRLLITSFASFGYYILSVLLYITASDYIFRIFWLLYIVCPSLNYGFWLHLSHLLVIIYCLSFFILRLLITSFASFGYYILSVLLYITASDYIFRIFWLLYIVCPSLNYGFWLHLSHLLVIIYCLSFFILRLLITSFASFGYYILSVLLYITASDYIFRIFWLLYIVCPSLYYGFWLHFSHLLVIIYCLSFFKLRLLITSFGHYILSVLL